MDASGPGRAWPDPGLDRPPPDLLILRWWASGSVSCSGGGLDHFTVAIHRLRSFADAIEPYPDFDRAPRDDEALVGPPNPDRLPVALASITIDFARAPPHLTVQPFAGRGRSELAPLGEAAAHHRRARHVPGARGLKVPEAILYRRVLRSGVVPRHLSEGAGGVRGAIRARRAGSGCGMLARGAIGN
jgi:hypothetical protein